MDNPEIGIPNHDEESILESNVDDTTKILIWDIPTDRVETAKNVVGLGLATTGICSLCCLIGVNPIDGIRMVAKLIK